MRYAMVAVLVGGLAAVCWTGAAEAQRPRAQGGQAFSTRPLSAAEFVLALRELEQFHDSLRNVLRVKAATSNSANVQRLDSAAAHLQRGIAANPFSRLEPAQIVAAYNEVVPDRRFMRLSEVAAYLETLPDRLCSEEHPGTPTLGRIVGGRVVFDWRRPWGENELCFFDNNASQVIVSQDCGNPVKPPAEPVMLPGSASHITINVQQSQEQQQPAAQPYQPPFEYPPPQIIERDGMSAWWLLPAFLVGGAIGFLLNEALDDDDGDKRIRDECPHGGGPINPPPLTHSSSFDHLSSDGCSANLGVRALRTPNNGFVLYRFSF